jgi:hypothetical protein
VLAQVLYKACATHTPTTPTSRTCCPSTQKASPTLKIQHYSVLTCAKSKQAFRNNSSCTPPYRTAQDKLQLCCIHFPSVLICDVSEVWGHVMSHPSPAMHQACGTTVRTSFSPGQQQLTCPSGSTAGRSAQSAPRRTRGQRHRNGMVGWTPRTRDGCVRGRGADMKVTLHTRKVAGNFCLDHPTPSELCRSGARCL